MKTYRTLLSPLVSAFAGLFLISTLQPAQAGTFYTNGPLSIAREYHTATLLSNNKILVAGGYNGSSIAITELYDPATGISATNAALTTSRYQHTATLLQNGKVLVAGGLHTVSGGGGMSPVATATAELYDPVANTWTPTGTMNTARCLHTATLLANGKVLVASGAITNGVVTVIPTNSAELYDPTTGTWTLTGPLGTARYEFTATRLTNGTVLVAGGLNQSGLVPTPEIYDPVAQQWTPTNSMVVPVVTHTATLMPNGHVMVAGGDSSSATSSATEEYNPATGSWTQETNMSSPRANATATLLPNGKVLVIGGFTFQATAVLTTNSAEIYDPNTMQWSAAGMMNSARAVHTATLLPGGQVVVIGGYGGPYLNSIETYEPTNATWTSTGGMVIGRDYHTLTLLTNGTVLAAGGQSTVSEIYTPAAGTWATSGTMTARRFQHTATLLTNGLVLTAGGYDSTNYLTSTETFNAASGSWTAVNPMNGRRGFHTATLLTNGQVLVAGGLNISSVPTNGAEYFDPGSGTWTVTSSLHLARQQHTATLLPNGKVMVAGGLGANNVYLNNVETYDPSTGIWTTNNPMNVARMAHTATLLPNGKVLVAGGFNQANDWLASAELYDPVSGTWTLTGSMKFSRDDHTATLLPSGQVLVADGLSLSTALKSAELYDPPTGMWVATNTMNAARYFGAAVLLPGGKVLVSGGFVVPGSSTNAELFDAGLGYSNSWQPTLTSIGTPVAYDIRVVLNGTQFRGIAEGSGGNGGQDSPADYPLVQLRALESGELTYVTVTNWVTNGLISVPLSIFPKGWALMTLFANGIPSQSGIVNVTVGQAFINFANLIQVYDGTAKSATVTTTPSGLPVTVTYNGSTSPPTNVGNYALSAVITDPNIPGSGTNLFQIVAPASRNFGVDVSHYQDASGIPETNWTQMYTQSNRFVFAKASEGLTGPDDTTMPINVSNAMAAGLLAGVYHFAHPENRPTTNGAVMEADHFLTFAGSAIGPGMLRPVLDMEETSTNLPPAAMTDWVLAFIQEVVNNRGTGATPIVYCSSGYAASQFDSRLASNTLWVLTGGGDPGTGLPSSTGVFTNWAFWQYSDTGTAGGISPIDLDVCHDEFVPLSSYLIPSALGGFALSSAVVNANGFQLSFTNVPGTHFTLLSSTNASTPLSNWTVVGTFVESPPGQFQFTDSGATNLPKRFYRVRSP